MRRQSFWSKELILSVIALLMSLISITVSIYQAYLTKRQLTYSQLPYLEITCKYKHTGVFSLFLKNKGSGTAIIKKVKIKSSFSSIPLSNFKELFNGICTYENVDIAENKAIGANEEIRIIHVENDFAPYFYKRYLETTEINVNYHSLENQEFVLTKDGVKPINVIQNE